MHVERLRASAHAGQVEIDLRTVVERAPSGGLPQQAQLAALVDAVHDDEGIDAARMAVARVLGEASMIDAAAVIASFHGLNLVADGTGCGLGVDEAATAGVRDALDLDRFEMP